jgi:hypothetical protein
MNRPLYQSTELYIILDEYLTYFRSKFDTVSKKKDEMLTLMIDLNQRMDSDPENIIFIEVDDEIAEKSKKVSKDLDDCKAYLRKIGIFCVDLALNNLTKDNEIFKDMISYFSRVENYENCATVKNILDEYFNE